jgi:hypothetical protein
MGSFDVFQEPRPAVGGRDCGEVPDRRPRPAASQAAAVERAFPHQARYCAAGDRDPLPAELSPDLTYAIDAEVFLVHAPDLDIQDSVLTVFLGEVNISTEARSDLIKSATGFYFLQGFFYILVDLLLFVVLYYELLLFSPTSPRILRRVRSAL